ncbi:hypothetical protein ACLI07_23100 (plasmid) [Providencia huaxiensis]|uniref:Uncharacterized protein n=7 Tax=Enterobacterales TaxID=91347 RepID=A0A7L8K9Y0_ECOLX|nr:MULTISPECIES: hypothetical protein [Enterobacterales]ELB1214875.1 hypothetical protein [Proteus mirabilis]ELY4881517.1 hypothetical protein [Morganella morganii]SPY66539.1 Uncharacterised protein [Providencia stuartii]ELR5094316.1 hypothetical protein [Providencia rettgeri]ELR5243165.1 hypothetical protein [Providencia rettgeri]
MFLYYLVYLAGMVLLYASVPLLPMLDGVVWPITNIIKFYAGLNVIFLFTVVWWNARKHFYFVWAGYLILMVGYFGFIYPNASDLLQAIVFVVAGVNVGVTFYDVVICRCKGIYKRTGRRYAVPVK